LVDFIVCTSGIQFFSSKSGDRQHHCGGIQEAGVPITLMVVQD
jgi:hypothetical protein